MGNKKNGKWVVAAVLGAVLLASAIAFTVQQVINANKGKPPTKQVEGEIGTRDEGRVEE